MSQTVEHATNKGWLAGCRCNPCINARSVWRNKRAQFLRLKGSEPENSFTDAEPYRKHLLRAWDVGYSLRLMSDVTGLPRPTLKNVIEKSDKVTLRVARRIRSIELVPPWERDDADQLRLVMIPGWGTWRRVRALVYMGHTLPSIARKVGMNAQVLQRFVNLEVPRYVRVETAKGVADVFKELTQRDAPVSPYATKARALARRNGWHGPGAWARIDDPLCLPDTEEYYVASIVAQDPGILATALRERVKEELGVHNQRYHEILKSTAEQGLIEREKFANGSVRNHPGPKWRAEQCLRERGKEEEFVLRRGESMKTLFSQNF